MFLALKEMRRAKARYGLLVLAVALLVFLILFQQTLQNGLLTAFVGAIRNQSAPVLVYSVDGRRNIQSSAIPPDMEQQVRNVDGVSEVGRICQSTLTVAAGGSNTSAALIGYEKDGLGSPDTVTAGRLPEATGEVVASESDSGRGFAVGDRVRVGNTDFSLVIVGQARDANLFASPTLYGTYETCLQSVRAANPDARTPLPNVLAVSNDPSVTPDQLSARIDTAVSDAEAFTRQAAADKTPGVAQVRQSFQIVFLLYGLVVPFVVGMFFLIVTFQKADALTLLHAIGAPGRRLVSSLLAQVTLVIAGALVVAIAAYVPMARGRIGGIPLQFEAAAVLFWSALVLTLGLGSALVAARHVLRIDPVSATTGAGVRT